MSVGYRAYFVALAIVIATAVFVLIFTGEARTLDGSSDNFFRNVMYDFQTLITGVLALGAAWWTVHTMQIADVKANRRHEQAMELGLRGDRLRIERALNPQGLSWALGTGSSPSFSDAQKLRISRKFIGTYFIFSEGLLISSAARSSSPAPNFLAETWRTASWTCRGGPRTFPDR